MKQQQNKSKPAQNVHLIQWDTKKINNLPCYSILLPEKLSTETFCFFYMLKAFSTLNVCQKASQIYQQTFEKKKKSILGKSTIFSFLPSFFQHYHFINWRKRILKRACPRALSSSFKASMINQLYRMTDFHVYWKLVQQNHNCLLITKQPHKVSRKLISLVKKI